MSRQARALGPYTYERHRPEETVLYKIVQENLETFLRLVQDECGRPLPTFVEKEFRDYLKCGILAHGFLRLHCLPYPRESHGKRGSRRCPQKALTSITLVFKLGSSFNLTPPLAAPFAKGLEELLSLITLESFAIL